MLSVQRRSLAKVSRQSNHLNAIVALGEVFSKTRRVVGTAVVDKDDFGVEIWEAAGEFSERGRQRARFVEHRDDDASLGPHPQESK
jgi:hypothetical protein